MPSRSIRFFLYWHSHCHLQSGLGVIVWHPGHLSLHDYTGVLLQYARIRYFSTSFYYSCSRYAHRSYFGTVSEVLHTPRVAHPDYPSCDRLRIVSKDELLSLFCEISSSWADHQNTPCSGFGKGSRFLNMVMTFSLHPLSYYNSITEPCAWFLLSLLEGISINFPSHFILSLIDVYKERGSFTIFVSYPASPHFSVMCAIDAATVRRSEAQLWPKQPQTETTAPPASSTPSTFAPFSSAGGVTLEAVMA